MTPRVRLSALALAAAGVLFLLYPAFRPWHDESTLEGAKAAMGSTAWVAAHFFAMIGFILVPLGLLALQRFRFGMAAVVVSWIGAGLTLPYYGAEDFGLYAVANSPGADVLGIAESFRYNGLAVTTFAVGLVTLGVGAVLAAIAVWRSGVLPRYSGVLFAAGFALFLPQFFFPPVGRIAHGVLLCAGCVWLAAAMWKSIREASATTHRRA